MALFLFEEYNCIFKVSSDKNADLVHPFLFVLTFFVLFFYLNVIIYSHSFLSKMVMRS